VRKQHRQQQLLQLQQEDRFMQRKAAAVHVRISEEDNMTTLMMAVQQDGCGVPWTASADRRHVEDDEETAAALDADSRRYSRDSLSEGVTTHKHRMKINANVATTENVCVDSKPWNFKTKKAS
jgi:hypothetical protein